MGERGNETGIELGENSGERKRRKDVGVGSLKNWSSEKKRRERERGERGREIECGG